MLIKTLSKKYIGNTTTNHGADMAISRLTDIQHDVYKHISRNSWLIKKYAIMTLLVSNAKSVSRYARGTSPTGYDALRRNS